jgi:hypothetical protein
MAFHGLTDAEATMVTQAYLAFLADSLDHTKAMSAIRQGFPNLPAFNARTVALLRKDYPEFDKGIRALERADDLELASMARSNIREMLDWRDPKTGKCNEIVTIWVEKSRGGYSERKQPAKRVERIVHPMTEDQVKKGLKLVANGDK